MKLTNGEIFNSREPLRQLLGMKFPVKVAYGLAKLASKLQDQYQIIEEVRNGLIKTYGEDKGGRLTIEPDNKNFPKFVSEVEELMNQGIEIVFSKVCLPEKVDERTIEIEPTVLMALDKFIEVE